MNPLGVIEEIARLFSVLRLHRRGRECEPRPIPRVTYQMRTPNGFIIETQLGMGLNVDGDLVHLFVVYSPTGAIRWCSVLLSASAALEIDDYCGSDYICERSRFLMAVCEEVLSSYLLQNSKFPPDSLVILGQITDSLRDWIDVVLHRRPVSA